MLLVALLGWTWLQSTPQTTTIDEVMDRATAYAAQYEEQLTSIIADETYDQTATVSRFRQNGTLYSDIRKRRLQADFLITTVDNSHVAIRNVHQVDGMTIESASSISIESKDSIPELLAESSRFNIGIQRNFNLPTFALEVLRNGNRKRFHFDRAGEEEINRVHVWKIAFNEVTGPALVRNLSGADFLSSGTLWIEPDSGRVLRTEMRSEGVSAGSPLTVTAYVTYTSSADLGFLVPVTMVENYNQPHVTLECRAEYSNFHQFEVEVKLNTGAVGPPTSGRPQLAESLSAARTALPSSAPLDVLLLFDRSALQQDTESIMQRATRSFLQGLGPQDRVAVGRMDSSIEMISWWTNSRAQAESLLSTMVNPAVAQTSSLYILMTRALRSELLPIAGRRRALVVLTSGRDDELFTTSWRSGQLPDKPTTSFQELLKVMSREQIPVQIVAINTDQNYQSSSSPDDVVNILGRYFPKLPLKTDFLKLARTNLEEIAKTSGKPILFPRRQADIPPLYLEISRNLRQ